MYKIFKSLVVIIWVMDIFNVNVSGISWLSWLQPVLTDGQLLDFWGWFIIWCILPSTDLSVKLNKED